MRFGVSTSSSLSRVVVGPGFAMTVSARRIQLNEVTPVHLSGVGTRRISRNIQLLRANEEVCVSCSLLIPHYERPHCSLMGHKRSVVLRN